MTTSVAKPDAVGVEEIAGHAVVLRYGPLESEYAALRTGALLIDRSHRLRMVFEGERRADTLTGLVTNDVGALVPGTGLYAAALTPRGKIITDVRVFARATDLLVDVPIRAAAGWLGMVRKYVNPRTTRYVDRSAELANVCVVGPRAREVVSRLVSVPHDVLGSLAPYSHIDATRDDTRMVVARVPDAGVEAYELFVPEASRASFWQEAIALGAVPGGLDVWEVARVEAGRPEWGLDIDETTLVQEANLDSFHAISYTKGCYTGQETVARVHFRGHVNRHLRGLRFDASLPAARGAQLFDAADKPVGDVRTSVTSPRLGGIALAMVRREVEPGSAIRARWEGAEGTASVLALPFPG